jgi:hypothetical protein
MKVIKKKKKPADQEEKDDKSNVEEEGWISSILCQRIQDQLLKRLEDNFEDEAYNIVRLNQ